MHQNSIENSHSEHLLCTGSPLFSSIWIGTYAKVSLKLLPYACHGKCIETEHLAHAERKCILLGKEEVNLICVIIADTLHGSIRIRRSFETVCSASKRTSQWTCDYNVDNYDRDSKGSDDL
ncbi:hypothetical protein ONS96_007754 [Cadophora gregata f. sp. sojae]|nr:hypothetical protein ONS96_007754 [Cadophora gregata f. sp. sojae]